MRHVWSCSIKRVHHFCVPASLLRTRTRREWPAPARAVFSGARAAGACCARVLYCLLVLGVWSATDVAFGHARRAQIGTTKGERCL